MFTLVKASPTRGDETSVYNVQLSKESVTLKEFIGHVLSRKEWGYIKVKSPFFTYANFEYKGSKLHDPYDQETATDIWDWYVTEDRTTASGGWGRMDYVVYITPNND